MELLNKGVKEMKGYVDKYAVCPFYSQEQGYKIHCEGFSSVCSLQTSFKSHEKLVQHKVRYCHDMKGYMQCPLYPAIYGQYGEEKK